MARTHPGISPAITEPETGGFLVTVSGEIDLSREDDPSLAFATRLEKDRAMLEHARGLFESMGAKHFVDLTS